MPVASKLQAFNAERVTVDATVGGVSLTPAKYLVVPQAKAADFTVESAQIRYNTDGTAPTSTTGRVANPTDYISLNNPSEIENFKAIRTGSTSATIHVIYYR